MDSLTPNDSPPGQNSLWLNFDAIPPRPLVGLARLYTDSLYKASVASHVASAAHRLGRPLEQHEVDALVEHRAKAFRTQAYDSIPIIGTCLVYERRGRNKFRFPFYTPKASFNPDVWPAKSWTLLTGSGAQNAWRRTRLFAYYLVAAACWSNLIRSYAVTVNMAENARDPRLENFRADIKALYLEEQAHRQGRPGMRPARDAAHESFASQQPASDQQTAASPWQQRRQDPTPQPVQSPVEDDPFDDASPVAPSARQRPQATYSANGSTAWQRIREQSQNPDSRASKDGTRSSWVEKREGSGRSPQGGDSYGYSKAEEEKSYAKSQAQKEFDQMLERERRGEGK